MLKNIKLIIFDLDGTLVNAYPAIIDSFNYTMRRFGLLEQEKGTIIRAVGLGDAQLLEPFLNGVAVDKALRVYRRHHARALGKKTRFLPGARRLLATLKQRHFKLAVASNRPTRFSHIILKHLKIKNYFDYILCGDRISTLKPAPDMLFKILRRFSCYPGQALYAGDMAIDILAGRRAGIKTVAVLTGSGTRQEIIKSRPFKIIRRIDALAKIVVSETESFQHGHPEEFKEFPGLSHGNRKAIPQGKIVREASILFHQ